MNNWKRLLKQALEANGESWEDVTASNCEKVELGSAEMSEDPILWTRWNVYIGVSAEGASRKVVSAPTTPGLGTNIVFW